jgi:AbrB family looped-hinge helix DNA binding protein
MIADFAALTVSSQDLPASYAGRNTRPSHPLTSAACPSMCLARYRCLVALRTALACQIRNLKALKRWHFLPCAVTTDHGSIHAMKTTIDAAGRLVIPKEIRRQAGLQPGMPLEVRWQNGRIEIEPAALPVTLVREGRLLVAAPQGEVGELTAAAVEDTRRTLARERGVGA